VHLKEILSVLAGILFFVAFIPYIRAILRKETQPVKATWIIWASLDTLTFAAMIAKHSVNGQIIGAVLGGWSIVFLALKYGMPGFSRLDKFCLGGAILGIVLWKVSGNATFGLMTSLIVVVIGSIPTFVSAWKDPSKEDKVAWTIFELSCVVAMFAIPTFTLADAAQPITFLLIETIMVSLVYLRPRMLARVAA
jgi:hypothetical protein